MPSYFKVFTKFWGDPDMERCSDDAKLLALYLLTGPHRRSEGLYRLPKLYICSDLGWTLERLAEPFRELLGEAFGEPGFMAYDEQAQVVLIRKALKYQPPDNANQVKACIRQLEDLPNTPLTSEFRSLAERYSERLAKALPEGFGQGIPDPLTPSPSPARTTDLATFTGVGDEPTPNNQTRREREGKTQSRGRPPRTPRHPSDEFVIGRARQIRAESGPDAVRAYMAKVSENYGQMEQDEQLRRLEIIMAQDAAAETADP